MFLFLKTVIHHEDEGAGICISFSGEFSNRFSRRVGGSEEILVDSNSTYVQDECSLFLLKNFCGGNYIVAF